MTTEAGRKQRERDELYTALEERARGKRCVNCRSEPRVAWIASTYVLRCNCYPKEPALSRAPDPGKERMGEMVERGLVKAQGLTVQEISQFISPNATPTEAGFFLRFCQAQGLNPFINEAYLIKYDKNAKAAIVIGLDTYLKRASRHPEYGGYRAGIVVTDRKEKVAEREGSMELPGDTLIGGWCEVVRKNWDPPKTRHTVSLKEYDRHQSLWKTHPATMISKVAIGQTLRRVFPEEYDLAELRVITDVEMEALPPDTGPGALVEGEVVEHEPPQRTQEQRQRDADDLFGEHVPPKEAASPPPTERGFGSVKEFWEACSERGWTQDTVKASLGSSLGEFLNGPPRRTWGEAFAAVERAQAREV